MITSLTLALALAFPFDLQSITEDADYAAQRCMSRDCTCQVRLGDIPREISISHNYSIEKVYFNEGSSELSSESILRISEIAKRNRGKYITVIGYTDGCGSNGYNNTLADQRASLVRRQISSAAAGNRISKKTVAEVSSYHDPSSRRVDIVIHHSSSSYPALPEIVADVYLVDASGSMSGKYQRWLAAISNSKKPYSKIYVSYSLSCNNLQDALSISPGGGTEIWYSYWKILKKMSPGQTLAVVSDFDSTVPLSRKEANILSSIVESKSIRVIAISP